MWSYPLAWLFSDRRRTFTIAYTFLIMHVYYLLITSTILIALRNNYILKKQNLYLTVLSSAFNGLSAVCLYIDLLLGRDMPGMVRLWAGNFVHPMYVVLVIHARIFHFILEDDWNRIYVYDKNAIYLKEAVAESSFPMKLLLLFKSPYHRKRYGVLVLLSAALLYHISTTLTIQLALDCNCTERSSLFYLFNGMSAIVYAGCAPWLLFRMQYIKDAYMMRNDLRWAIATGVPLLSFLMINWIPYPWIRELNQLFPPLLIVSASYLCIHSFIVVLPILRAFVWMLQKHQYTPPDTSVPVSHYDYSNRRLSGGRSEPLVKPRQPPRFEDALANPHFYGKFRKHMMREFTSHHILFQAEAREFILAYNYLEEPSEVMHEHAVYLFEKYIAEGAMCELTDVKQGTREMIERCLRDGVYNEMLFEQARIQVYYLMKRDSYPRFIQSLSPLELEHFIHHCGTLGHPPI